MRFEIVNEDAETSGDELVAHDIEEGVEHALKDFAKWAYRQIEAEAEYQSSNEHIDEALGDYGAREMNRFVKCALAGEVVVNIGQVTASDKRALDKEVRAGRLVKWRGYWFPIAGATFGIGPLKTCWATPPLPSPNA